MVFDISTPVYEGPLDLLVSLIEKREIFINDISLSQVTDDYIQYINSLEQKDISNMTDFILIASTLVLIKSKSLLPTLALSDEEEDTIEDLENRIELYKKIREYAVHLAVLIENGSSYERGDITRKEVIFAPSKDMTMDNIFSTIQSVIQKMPEKEKQLPKVNVEKTMSLQQTIESLRDRIRKNIQTSFKEFTGDDKGSRVHVIIHFLALLELIKQEMVSAQQYEDFGDIIIESDSVTTPKYGI